MVKAPPAVPATHRFDVDASLMSARFTPSGEVLTAGDNGVRSFTPTGQPLVVFRDGPLCWEAAVSPDGRHVLGAFRDNVTCLWDSSGRVVAQLEPDREPALPVALANERALTGHPDLKTLTVWEVPSGKKIQTIKLKKAAAMNVDISADGLRGACGAADKTVSVWDLETGTLLQELKGHEGRITSVHFSADGQRLVSGSADKTARVWDLATGACVVIQPQKLVACAVFAPDGRVATDGDRIRLWKGEECTAELASGAFDGRNVLWRLGFSRDGARLVAPGYRAVEVWDL